MIENKKVTVVLPAYNAAKTLLQTYQEVPLDIVDEIILVDDGSTDETLEVAKELNVFIVKHKKNCGYGANQKTCYNIALERGADIIIMLHPDYQYTPRLITAMVAMLKSGHYDAVLASRILGKGALKGGMPFYKFIANRLLTFIENILLGIKLSEYHTGYRGWTKELLEKLSLEPLSDDFIFDNQMLAQVAYLGFEIGEISCPTKYFEDASSINFSRSVIYGIGVIETAIKFRFQKLGWLRSPLFPSV